MGIDWEKSSAQLLFNPRIPEKEKEQLLGIVEQLPELKNHFLVATSGSTGKIKWTALSKEAVLLSAHSVNRHLEAAQNDRWLNPLPLFHVGGLGIAARAFLIQSKVIHTFDANVKWNVDSYMQQLISFQATLTSLVPAQLFDLVAHNQCPPSSLRALIVGGGRVDEALYFKAVEMGWPVLLSYGMTECSSQIATSTLGSWKDGLFPLLQPLQHMNLDSDEEGFLKIRSGSLLTGYLEMGEAGPYFIDPKRHDGFHTQDIVVFKENKVASVRRADQMIKIAGESVDLIRLEEILKKVKNECQLTCDLALMAQPDERTGHAIHLVADSHEGVAQLRSCFNARVFPFERIREVHIVESIPRSPLGKLQTLTTFPKQTT